MALLSSRARCRPPSAILAFPTGSLHILRAPCSCYCCSRICLCCLAAPVPQLFIFIDWNVSQAVKYRSLICSCLSRAHGTTNSCSCCLCTGPIMGREPSSLATREKAWVQLFVQWIERIDTTRYGFGLRRLSNSDEAMLFCNIQSIMIAVYLNIYCYNSCCLYIGPATRINPLSGTSRRYWISLC